MRKARNSRTDDRKVQIRCAIYTRKSSEEGLEQDFNSLDAQRESCEAFIRSQKHEGWVCLSELYDDGGISGATMERPALKRLLADIEADRIDAVVVYKVDRLTRACPILPNSWTSSTALMSPSCRSLSNSIPPPAWDG
jgi:site-specific DNA recombinase